MEMNLLDDDGWLERTWPPERPGYLWRRKRVAGEHLGAGLIELPPGESAASLGLTGRETFDLTGLADALGPRCRVRVTARAGGSERTFDAIARLDGPIEVGYYRQGGILPAVLRRLASA